MTKLGKIAIVGAAFGAGVYLGSEMYAKDVCVLCS